MDIPRDRVGKCRRAGAAASHFWTRADRRTRRGGVAAGVTGVVVLGLAFVNARPADPAVGAVELEPVAAQPVIPWDLPNLDHERVDYWIARFDTVPDMRKKMEGFLERAGRYVPMLTEKLEERGMPRDLIYLAMIESGFQPHAYSPARASGLWQFIGETGMRYGLAIDRAVDERNDPVRSTDAALDYLQELHDRFGSWYLAAAAYNTGENRVGRVMHEAYGRERAATEGEYYEIWDRLPSETRDYVPLMIAAARIGKQPHSYSFDHVRPEPPLAYDEIVLPPATDLEAVAAAAGVELEAILALNPHFKLRRTPNDRDYPVRLPAASKAAFAAAWGHPLQNAIALAD